MQHLVGQLKEGEQGARAGPYIKLVHACVANGARPVELGGIGAELQAELQDAHEEWIKDKQRSLEEERCLASPTGVLTLLKAGTGAEESGWAWVKGTARWNRRFLVLTRVGNTEVAAAEGRASQPEGEDAEPVLEPLAVPDGCSVVLHRFDNELALAPLGSRFIDAGVCGAEASDTAHGSEAPHGLVLSGVEDGGDKAARGGLGAAFSSIKAATQGDFKAQDLYRLAFEDEDDRATWLSAFVAVGCHSDIDKARLAEQGKLAQKKNKEEEAMRVALGLPEEGGGEGGGDKKGGAWDAAKEARQLAAQNVQKVSELSDATDIMQQRSMAFGDMAKQMREQAEKKSKGFGIF